MYPDVGYSQIGSKHMWLINRASVEVIAQEFILPAVYDDNDKYGEGAPLGYGGMNAFIP